MAGCWSAWYPRHSEPAVPASREAIRKTLQKTCEMCPVLAMTTILEFGPFRLDTDAAILFHGADPTPLSQRAFALLALLARRPGTPASKEALLEAAWPSQASEDTPLA